METETDKHKCEEADKPLENMKVFLLLKLATDAEGNMKAAMHYHGPELTELPERVGKLCKAVADAVGDAMSAVLEAAYIASQLQEIIERVQSEKEKAETNDSNETNSKRQPAETTGIPGELKQHGRIVH